MAGSFVTQAAANLSAGINNVTALATDPELVYLAVGGYGVHKYRQYKGGE